MKYIFVVCAVFFAAPLSAQEINPCGWQTSARNIVEPWPDNVRSFANGDVRIVNLDTIEPAVGFAYLMVMTPPFDELGGRECVMISRGMGLGFAGVHFDTMTSQYDPAIGLTLEVVVNDYDPETSEAPLRMLRFTVNQATGEVAAILK